MGVRQERDQEGDPRDIAERLEDDAGCCRLAASGRIDLRRIFHGQFEGPAVQRDAFRGAGGAAAEQFHGDIGITRLPNPALALWHVDRLDGPIFICGEGNAQAAGGARRVERVGRPVLRIGNNGRQPQA